MIDVAEIKDRARGNWKSIHISLGILPKYLTGKHSPCPHCGGKDRYRYTDHNGEGGYICNQCGSGDGFALLMLVLGYSFTEARDVVAKQLGYDVKTGVNPSSLPPKPPLPKRQLTTPKDKLKHIQGFLWGARAITAVSPAGRYLTHRGLDWRVISRGLHDVFFRDLDYWTASPYAKPLKVGTYPAMVAPIRLNGELMGVHITYLQKALTGENSAFEKLVIKHPQTGGSLTAKKMQSRYTGALTGASVQLYTPQDGILAVCEGIETALAVRELYGMPTWAGLSAWGVRNIALPADLKKLYIIADNDDNQTGQDASRDLANRAIMAGIEVKHWQPQTVGFDALDELNNRKNKEVKS